MITRLTSRFPTLTAASVYAIAVLLAFNKFFSGMVLLPEYSDQRDGFPPRLFASEYFREFGSIPEWSPYLFGGFPFVSNTGFGDTFFPTAILRLLLPVDQGMALGLMVFVFLAGVFAFLFLRSLQLGWGAAFVGGAAYMFTGMVVSMVSPGHDGKLYVSAMLPLAMMFLYRGTARADWRQYLYFGVTVGFCLLSPHFQATYYLLMAAGFFWLFLTFFSGERRAADPWWRAALFFAGSLVVGFAIASVQLLPFIEYLPFSPRGTTEGMSTGWDYATSWAMPPEEIFGVFLPGFNGVDFTTYFGRNPLKLHSEYAGAVVGLLALASFKLTARRKMSWFFVFLIVYALLFAWGGHTPFYHLPYNLLPGISKTRAPSIIFFLASFSFAALAAFGTQHLLSRSTGTSAAAPPEQKGVRKRVEVPAAGFLASVDRGVLYGFAALVAIALIATVGGWKGTMSSIVDGAIATMPGKDGSAQEALERSYPEFVKLMWLAVLLSAGAVALLLPATMRKFGGTTVAVLLGAIVLLDLWHVESRFIRFSERAELIMGSDEVVAALKADTTLHRVLPVPGGHPYAQNYLMAHGVRTALGYNGFELHAYDELLGGKGEFRNLLSPSLWQLLGVRYLVVDNELNEMLLQAPDIKDVLVPVGEPLRTHVGSVANILRVVNPLPYAFLVKDAWRVDAPTPNLIATVLAPGFDPRGLLLIPPSSDVGADSVSGLGAPVMNAVTATEERPGLLRFELERPAEFDSFLYVAENYYPAWHAEVDGEKAEVVRAQVSLMAVPLKAGARQVELRFSLGSYHTGRIISLVTLAAVLLIAVVAQLRSRRQAEA